MPREGSGPRQITRLLLATVAVGLVIGAGIWLIGDTGSGSKSGRPRNNLPESSTSPGAKLAGPAGPGEPTEPARSLPPVVCPPDVPGCVSATGRVIYVEKVDPDGDGDAHFVTASTDSVTGPGITIFDVRTDLRPDPLPGIGDLVGGAGPVYEGHAGQRQIEVVSFETFR